MGEVKELIQNFSFHLILGEVKVLIQNFLFHHVLGEMKILASVSSRTGGRSMFYKHLLFFIVSLSHCQMQGICRFGAKPNDIEYKWKYVQI